jgi:replicative DNA helicase
MQIKQQTAIFRFTPVSSKIQEIFSVTPASSDGFRGIPSGFHYLDHITGGFRPSTLTTVAVRQGMGKTAMLTSLISNMGIRGGKIGLAVFSFERSADKLVRRLVESEAGTSVDKILNGIFKASENERIHQTLRDLAGSHIMIDDTPGLFIEEIVHRIDLLAETHKPEIVFIDYLDLIKLPDNEKENEKSTYERILRILSQTAREISIPIVLFHQVCQPYTNFADGYRLKKSDLSNDIIDHSDSIYLLQRADSQGSMKSFSEISVLKHSEFNDEKIIPLRFIESTDRFVDF